MIAMRYGSVPIVRATGGLKDTVHEGATGFMFPAAEAGSMVETLQRALYLYAYPEKWIQYQHNGMLENFSWQRSACQYAEVYRSLVADLVASNPVP
jgi:starch synthase